MWDISERRRHSTLWVSYDTENRRAAYTVTTNWERNGDSHPYQPHDNARQSATSKRSAYTEYAEYQRRERQMMSAYPDA